MDPEEVIMSDDEDDDETVTTLRSSIAWLRNGGRLVRRPWSVRVVPADEPAPPLRYQQGGSWRPMPLTRGLRRRVRLLPGRGVAWTASGEGCHGYVYTARSLLPGEKLVLQVLTQVAQVGFCLTYRDPAKRTPYNDADLFLVVSDKTGSRRWDEFGFCVTPSGEVRISKNGAALTVMQVDHTLRFWLKVHIQGSAQKVRIMSCVPTADAPPRLQARQSPESFLFTPGSIPAGVNIRTCHFPALGTIVRVIFSQNPNHQQRAATAHFTEQIPHSDTFAVPAPDPSVATTLNAQMWSKVSQQPQLLVPGPSSSQNNVGADCTICYDQPINCVLYMCGHMCTCYRCAILQWKGEGGGQCPLCRAHIRDVIFTYKS